MHVDKKNKILVLLSAIVNYIFKDISGVIIVVVVFSRSGIIKTKMKN